MAESDPAEIDEDDILMEDDSDDLGAAFVAGVWDSQSEESNAEDEIDYENVHTTKVIETRTVFDILMKIDQQDDFSAHLSDYVEIVDQYDPDYPAQETMTLETVKAEFQTEQTEKGDDEIYNSTILAWSEVPHEIYLINLKELGDLSGEIVPLTDSVFPVFVMGPEHLPCRLEQLYVYMSRWEAGLYLVLEEARDVDRYVIDLNVHRDDLVENFKVSTYGADLNFYRVYQRWTDETQSYLKYMSNHGPIYRILDSSNATQGIYGLYAGGPLPELLTELYQGFRLTWDHPLKVNDLDLMVPGTSGILRYDIDYQPGSKRVGYYLTRDALLVVTDLTGTYLDFSWWRADSKYDYRSVLKEGTYVVCDGSNMFTMNHCVDVNADTDKQRRTFPFRDFDDISYLSPYLVFVPPKELALSTSLDTYIIQIIEPLDISMLSPTIH